MKPRRDFLRSSAVVASAAAAPGLTGGADSSTATAAVRNAGRAREDFGCGEKLLLRITRTLGRDYSLGAEVKF